MSRAEGAPRADDALHAEELPQGGDAPRFDEAHRRDRMVERQLAARGIADRRVLDAMRRVPREAFVAPHWQRDAYADSPLPIGEGQTISQPYVVALMLEAAELHPRDRVLDVGAGSGYASAVASLMVEKVCAIERHAVLADAARERLRRLGYRNVELRCGDGSLGWPEAAPFDAILVAAGGPAVPEALRNRLAEGGRLVMPIGSETHGQRLLKLTRVERDRWREDDLGAVAFVPLIGAEGWPTEGGT
jgi:protein-L-isoaspartate(D-aspartate) O-methyltransferase